MRLKQILLFAISVTLVFNSCIKQIEVATRYERPVLVVEGAITTDTVPYSVRLTYTRPVTAGNKVPDEFLEKDAAVSIADDLGNTTALSYLENGYYTTTDSSYIGKVGRSYTVEIALKDGRKFISVPEKIPAPVPIEKINIQFDPKFTFDIPTKLRVYINVNDPSTEENYYKWDFSSYIPRRTLGISCGGACVFGEYCFQRVTNAELQVFSDAATNGNIIKDQLMGISPIYWYGTHYVHIMQHSISRAAYQFSVKLTEQQTRTGSILDPLPASVKGNVFNAADSGDFALGFFSASSVTHKRAVVIPFDITQYQLDLSALIFIPAERVVCFDYFPNALPYPMPPARQNPPPPGYQNAEVIEVHW